MPGRQSLEDGSQRVPCPGSCLLPIIRPQPAATFWGAEQGSLSSLQSQALPGGPETRRTRILWGVPRQLGDRALPWGESPCGHTHCQLHWSSPRCALGPRGAQWTHGHVFPPACVPREEPGTGAGYPHPGHRGSGQEWEQAQVSRPVGPQLATSLQGQVLPSVGVICVSLFPF